MIDSRVPDIVGTRLFVYSVLSYRRRELGASRLQFETSMLRSSCDSLQQIDNYGGGGACVDSGVSYCAHIVLDMFNSYFFYSLCHQSIFCSCEGALCLIQLRGRCLGRRGWLYWNGQERCTWDIIRPWSSIRIEHSTGYYVDRFHYNTVSARAANSRLCNG